MKLRFSKGAGNHHGTQPAAQPWNRETVRGPKFTLIDVKAANKTMCGFMEGCKYYWRLIFYFPSGACWYFDAFERIKEQR